jgi:S-adenosylmethionine-dependent methyltransferase
VARQDTVFDGIAAAFEGDIYGTSKGYIRLGVLWADLVDVIPAIVGGTFSILDAGGGAGHLAVRLAQLGNRVVLAEPSGEMIERAHAAVRDAGVGEPMRLVQAPIQDLPTLIGEQFDLVICHAVLEWVADPPAVLARVAPFVKPGGKLSLLFYNRNAVLMKLVLAGSYAEAIHDMKEPSAYGWGAGAIPLAEDDVRKWLTDLGLDVASKAGIRIFHDLLADELRAPERLAELLDVELAMRRLEPFASLAQHIHLVAARTRP